MACRRGACRLGKDGLKFLPRQQTRCYKLHESDSQRLLQEQNVPILHGKVVKTSQEARQAAENLSSSWVILKPRIRDENITRVKYETCLREGIKRNDDPAVVEAMAKNMLGWKARTPQADGGYKEHFISSLYVREMAPKGSPAWHLIMTVDREQLCPVLVLREVATLTSYSFPIRHSEGVTGVISSNVAERIGSTGKEKEELDRILHSMFKIFVEKDLTRLKVKLGRLDNEDPPRLVCQTSNMTVDDAATKRQPEIFDLRDLKEEDPSEVEAEQTGLVYVKMDGNIGNVVNGAGLAMATNDAIDYYGGKSANFLDAGGQATKETMVKAFAIVLRDKSVKAVIVNVYGGITNCAMIADSIIAATIQLGPIKVPIVVRLQGTNSTTGLKLLEEANLGLHVEADFGAAAAKVVELAGPYQSPTESNFGKAPRKRDTELKI